MGGTFNPIHCGHIEMAKAALSEFLFDQVWLLPSRDPPHKPDPQMAPEADRWQMVVLACENEPGLVPCDIEMKRGGVTYTVDTLRELTADSDAAFTYIIGSDTLLLLETWRSPQAVFDLCDFAVFLRSGVDDAEVLQKIAEFTEKYGARIHLGRHRCMQVSSTEIRERAQAGQSLAGLVPGSVAEYISKNGVYRERD